MEFFIVYSVYYILYINECIVNKYSQAKNNSNTMPEFDKKLFHEFNFELRLVIQIKKVF